MKCPVCDQTWPADMTLCVCGYDFTTRDPRTAIARYERELALARGMTALGIGLVVLVAVVLRAIIPDIGWYLLTFAPGGALMLAAGLTRKRRAEHRLRLARKLLELPAARVV